jgi:ubiquinone/menaquinone biosynthesis C-methylase UbiE
MAGFTLTKEAIQRYVIPRLRGAEEYLELGPGPGTWTKVIRAALPKANMHLVDISRAMLVAAKSNLSPDTGITYTESDFLEWRPEKMYDIFFSSRAIEYFPDKKPVLKNIADTLRPGGEAFIITKYPHYTRMKLLGKDPGVFHRGQITPEDLRGLAQEVGMSVAGVHPVFVVLPLLGVAPLHLLLTRFLRLFPWNPITAWVTESYLIHLQKV